MAEHQPEQGSAEAPALRRKAEERVQLTPLEVDSMSDHEVQRLVYELQVHQVELELQNEALRESQLELAASRDRLADLYDFAPDGYLTLGPGGNIIEANLTAAAMLGTERGNLLQRRVSDFIAPECQDTAYLYWQSVFRSPRERQVCEMTFLRSEGNPLHARLESSYIDSSHGEEPRCRVALIDIGDLRQARDSLHELNRSLEQRVASQVREIELLARAVGSTSEGVLITADHLDWWNSRVVYINPALCTILACTGENAIGKSPAQLLRGHVDPSWKQQFKDSFAATGTFGGELVIGATDCTSRTLEIVITPVMNKENECTHFVAVHRDISERKLAEKKLKERKERLRVILDTVPDAIVTIDSSGVVQDCNPGVERMFGFAAAELVGKNVSMLMPSPYREAHDGYLSRYRGREDTRVVGFRRELKGQHRDGHVFPISLSVNEIDHLGLFLGVIQDVSELRRLQRQVLSAADEVQWRVGQALHDGPQQALAGLGLLARGLAQDLEQESSPQAAIARRLSDGLSGANGVIRGLARGLVPIHIEPDGLVGGLQRLARHTAEDHGIHCEFIGPQRLVMADGYTVDQLYHIAREAVNNAVRHARADHILIYLEKKNDTLTLRVVDDGVGFDPKKTAGAGLGLHIMPHRASTIGAELTVASGPEGGTEVGCTLVFPAE